MSFHPKFHILIKKNECRSKITDVSRSSKQGINSPGGNSRKAQVIFSFNRVYSRTSSEESDGSIDLKRKMTRSEPRGILKSKNLSRLRGKSSTLNRRTKPDVIELGTESPCGSKIFQSCIFNREVA